MSKERTLWQVGGVAGLAVLLAVASAGVISGGGEAAAPPQTADRLPGAANRGALRIESPATDWVPAAPGGAAVGPNGRRDARAPLATSQAQPAGFLPILHVDKATRTILGDDALASLGFTVENASRRDVIEFVIAETAAVGLVTVPPSKNERTMGVRDTILGSYWPELLVSSSNSFRWITRADAQALLSGRSLAWPGTSYPVAVFAPDHDGTSELLAELVIPGDRFAAHAKVRSFADFSKLFRGRDGRYGLGITNRAARESARADSALATLNIEGFEPRLDLRVVFRDQHRPELARILMTMRSKVWRERFGDRITIR